jgi:dienelactone hydrolase
MDHRPIFLLGSCLLVASLTGCQPNPNIGAANAAVIDLDARDQTPVPLPDLGPAQPIQPGVLFREVTLRRGETPMRLWCYQPARPSQKTSLVLVPPAGSTCFVGMRMGDGDRAEHYPYVRAGFTVVSFDIDGPVENQKRAADSEMFEAAKKFRDARAGLENARTALDFALAKLPGIDPERVYIAGHSSAGTLALQVAEHEPRIKGCVAYAAVIDLVSRLAKVTHLLDHALPGYAEFLRLSSPKTQGDKLKCPLFLFAAMDDTNVSARESIDFAAQLKATNSQVTLVTTPQGGHYGSMIKEGMPTGIHWIRALEARSKDANPGARK